MNSVHIQMYVHVYVAMIFTKKAITKRSNILSVFPLLTTRGNRMIVKVAHNISFFKWGWFDVAVIFYRKKKKKLAKKRVILVPSCPPGKTRWL